MQTILVTIALAIIRIISWLPIPLIRGIGWGIGYLGYALAYKRRKIGLKNLTLCFPQFNEAQKRKIICQHFQYLVTAALEYGIVMYASKRRIKRLVKLVNVQYLLEHYETRPVILFCPHFVGLDLGAIRLTLDFIGDSIYSRQKSSVLTDKLSAARLRFIQGTGAVFARQEGLRQIIRRLRQYKRLFYYLPDQDFGERDSIYVPFFAHPTCATVSILPKLVELTKAVVVPMAVYSVGNHYEVVFSQAWQNYPSGNLNEDVIRMNQFIEQAILTSIPQYFWLHKRFKTQPNLARGFLYKDC